MLLWIMRQVIKDIFVLFFNKRTAPFLVGAVLAD